MPGVTTGAGTWKYNDDYVEQNMELAPLIAASPDTSLVFAGPANYGASGNDFVGRLLPLGMFQRIDFTQNQPLTPSKSIGSSRVFYLTGDAQVRFAVSRLWCYGRNLLRALYTSVKQARIDVSQFDEKAAISDNSLFWMNLGSELFKIPIGLGFTVYDKTRHHLGGVYMERCMVDMWQTSLITGAPGTAENVTGIADRPIPLGATIAPTTTNPTYSAVFAALFPGTAIQDIAGSTK